MKQFHYFVSYQYKNQEDYGFGQTNLVLKQLVSDAEQLDEIRNYLVDRFKFTSVVILNFILLREEA